MSVRNLLAIVAVVVLSGSVLAAPEKKFIRGDCQADGDFNIEDVFVALGVLFEGERVECDQACDSNADGKLSTIDAILILQVLFEREYLPAPFPDCGVEEKDEDQEQEKLENFEGFPEQPLEVPLSCRRHRACV